MPAESGRRSQGVQDRVSEGVAWISFCGIEAAQVMQDYVLWEMLLNEHPSLNGIVELGTWKGGFSLYLDKQARERDMFFRTYDIKKPDREIPGFMQLDIFAHAQEIGQHMQRHDPVALLCDGGNKPRELRIFSRWLTPESVIVVHDWNDEIVEADVPENVEMIYRDLCENIDSMSRVFRVKKA